MKKIIIIISLFVVALTNNKINNNKDIYIPFDSIRFRIISSTDSEIDLETKRKLKEYIEPVVFDLVSSAKSKEDASEIIVDNLEFINNKIEEKLGSGNYKIDFGINYFPSKVYKGVVYEEGYYESLVITLGNGNGSNWWCVLFPPLCLLEENKTTTDVEYKFFISSIINHN